MTDRQRTDPLGSALRRLLRPQLDARMRVEEPHDNAPSDPGTRLDALEREMSEVRTRVNALFFAVLSVTTIDVIVRAVHP